MKTEYKIEIVDKSINTTLVKVIIEEKTGIKLDLFKILDWIRTDEKTLNSKYPNIKYRINPGNRYGELPFIEIDN